MNSENRFFSHSKCLFCRPFDTAAPSSRITPTRYASGYMDVIVFWLVTPCIYQITRRHILEHQSSETYEVTEHRMVTWHIYLILTEFMFLTTVSWHFLSARLLY